MHTLTLYVGVGTGRCLLIDDILDLQPGRVIFNPAANPRELDQHLRVAGIAGIEGCTLVMLKTRQFWRGSMLTERFADACAFALDSCTPAKGARAPLFRTVPICWR